jgi:hypothetical protein
LTIHLDLMDDLIKTFKFVFLIFWMTIGSNCFADKTFTKKVSLNWQDPSIILLSDSTLRRVIRFENCKHLPENNFLPSWIFEVEAEIKDFEIKDPVFVKISGEELALLDYKSGEIQSSYNTRYKRREPNTLIQILPFKTDLQNREYFKLVEFTLVYNLQDKKSLNNKRESSNETSVLATGNWVKIGVTTNGIYKIDNAFLRNAGFNIASIDPRNIKIFGNGGKMLPQRNSDSRPKDLIENAIYIFGENDGVFDQGDYILFYGQGPDSFEFDAELKKIKYSKNIYSDTTYYFLTIGSNKGLRISNQENKGIDFPKIKIFDDYHIHEKDLENLLSVGRTTCSDNSTFGGSGREWYGERFSAGASRNFQFDLPGIVPNSFINLTSAVMASSCDQATFLLSFNGQQIGNQRINPISDFTYSTKGFERIDNFAFTAANNLATQISINYTFEANSFVRPMGFLNYFILHTKRNLQLYGNQTHFFSLESLNNTYSTFEVQNFNDNTQIWDISNPLKPFLQQRVLANGIASFGSETSALKKYVTFNISSLPAPISFGAVSNQNLKGENIPDLVIITHPKWISEARRLAEFRRINNGLDVLVTTPQKIYNEFSSGSQDITAIRDFIKYLYDLNPKKLKHLLLFGKSSFDYKDRIKDNTNFVPIYQSRNSLHPIFSYSSDDYYGFLDDDEGDWIELNSGDHLLDIGIGRLPVKTINEAKIIVDKLIKYSTSENRFGNWRSILTFVADDGDFNTHQRDADRLANFVDTTFSRYDLKKIYIDAFPQLATPIGLQAPSVRETLSQTIESGTLIVNYTGHGNESVWASQEIFNNNVIQGLKNSDKLPLFVTATCEYGRHDNPFLRIGSGAELLLLRDGAGAIGLITSARPVISNTNYLLNAAFYSSVFHKTKEGNYKQMGEVFMETKNNSLNGSINRNFSYLGDPSMTLAYPEDDAIITSIKGSYSGNGSSLKALEKVFIEGEIKGQNGNILADFNGTLQITIFDKVNNIQTLGADGPVMTFRSRNNILFRGSATVNKGKFSFEFIVPKNIDYNLGKGKISMYAFSEKLSRDAAGGFTNFIIGGSITGYEDSTPPFVKIYLNHTQFKSGDIVNSNPLLIAKLSDESGINITSKGVGQEIVLILNNSDPIVLNDYFENDRDSFKNGTINYELNKLEKGKHNIKIRAWDINNNAGESSIEFIVGENQEEVIQQLINFPNPVRDKTKFLIQHTKEGENLDIKIEIYNLKGELIHTKIGNYINSNQKIDNLEWDGTSSSGINLTNGLYIYKVTIRSQKDGSINHRSNKLVLLK